MTRTVAAGDGERHRTGQVRPRRLPLLLAAGCILVTALATALMVVNGQGIVGSFNLDLIVVGSVYAVGGGILTSRVPENRMGWVFLAAAWMWALDLLLGELAWSGTGAETGAVASSLPLVGFAAWFTAWLWMPGSLLLLFVVPLLFPDGHLPPPQRSWTSRWRNLRPADTVTFRERCPPTMPP